MHYPLDSDLFEQLGPELYNVQFFGCLSMNGKLVFKCQHFTAPNAAVVANSEENNVDDSITFSFNSLCFSVTFSCSAAGDGIHPDLSDCSKYIQCHGGKLYNQRCPTGLLFNPKIKACDWPANVECP